MKKRGVRVATAAGLTWLAAAVLSAQAAATVPTTGSARVLAAIRLSRVLDLSFGAVVPSGSAGTVTVTPASARSATGGATLAGGTAVQAGRFRVQGQANKSYTIALPASVVVTSGANSMTVNAFTSNRASPATLPGGGAQNINVGATIGLGANQPAGTYANTFSVTVAYN
jgi:spore coat protein U-like protein